MIWQWCLIWSSQIWLLFWESGVPCKHCCLSRAFTTKGCLTVSNPYLRCVQKESRVFFSPSSGGSKLRCLWQNTTHWPYTKHCLQYFLLTLSWFVRIFTNYKYLQIITNYYTVATLGEESTLSNQLPQLWASWTRLFPTGQEFLTKDGKARLGFSWESNHFRVTVFPIQGRDFNYS